MTIDLNRSNLSSKPISALINELIESTEPPSKTRQYLGASSVGDECLRKVEYDWFCDPEFSAKTLDIFGRGHFFEERMRRHLILAGFKFAPDERLGFEAVDGLFRGHADGIIDEGPELPGLIYPCLWEAKCMNNKNSKAIERDGLTGIHAKYAGQVALYQAYLNITNPALFSVFNADTAERFFFTVVFDAQLAQTMSDRAVIVIEAARAGELLPRAYDNPDDWHCRFCSHRKRCWAPDSSQGGAS